MLHAKFQGDRTSGSREDLKRFSYMGMAVIYKFMCPLPKEAPHNLALIGHVVTEKEMFEKMVIYMYIAPGQGQTTPWGQFFFKNVILMLIWSFASSFSN